MKNGLRSSLGVCSGLASSFELIAPNHATQLLNYESASPNEHIYGGMHGRSKALQLTSGMYEAS